ncbi:MAG: CPBP family intramembrane metalloprotease [Planctomycetes bacterium]|nr:CPBP family intramembrane metalloprotease [Planctomycetota bacterium]
MDSREGSAPETPETPETPERPERPERPGTPEAREAREHAAGEAREDGETCEQRETGDPGEPREPGEPGVAPLEAAARRALWIEVLVVLSVGWFGSYYYSITDHVWPETVIGPHPFWYTYLGWLVYYLPLIALILLVARRAGDSWGTLGLVQVRPLADAATVGACFFGDHCARVGYAVFLLPFIKRFLPEDDPAWWLRHFPAPQGPWQWAFVALPIFVAAFYEELLMRAYLVPRLVKLLGSPGEALAVSAILFALGHVYMGFESALLAGLFGFVYGFLFLLTGRIWPLAVSHALNNLYAFSRDWTSTPLAGTPPPW